MEESVRINKERGIWDKQAPGYEDRVLATYKEAYARSVQKACSILSAEQEVLEIGCGTGIIALGVAPCARHVVATDISPRMIEVAKKKQASSSVSNVEFQVYDGYAVPYEAGTFDTVLLFNTLHVVKEPASLLREAHRVLKPGGYLVTATDCYAEPVPVKVRLMLIAQKLLKLLGIIPFMSYYRKKDLHRLLEHSSFAVVESEVLHPAPVNYYLLARKD